MCVLIKAWLLSSSAGELCLAGGAHRLLNGWSCEGRGRQILVLLQWTDGDCRQECKLDKFFLFCFPPLNTNFKARQRKKKNRYSFGHFIRSQLNKVGVDKEI